MKFSKYARLLFIPLLICFTVFFVYPQEEEDEDDDEDIYIESDWSLVAAPGYSRGDQLFLMNIGLIKPLFYMDKQSGYLSSNMGLGGMLSLGYVYFLNRNFFLGGELSGMFASTIGENMYYLIPIGLRGGFQFTISRFEFPFSLMLGIAPQTHQQRSYLGMIAKPTAGAFFRFNSEWSFGLNTALWWAPQWSNKTRVNYKGNVNIHGFFWDINLGARYHF